MAIALSIALILLLSAVLLREAWRTWQPMRLLRAGEFTEAATQAERLERSWLRVFPTVRTSARFVRASALHLAGDLEASIETLAPLHRERLRGNLRYAVCSVDAANLVLLDRDHARASALLDEAAGAEQPVEDILLAAHAKLGEGDTKAAAALFEKADSDEDLPQPQAAIVHTLRGLYLSKMGSPIDAQRELSLAAETSLTNVYVRRARAALEPAPSDPGDPRSSLAPQVVDEDSSPDVVKQER
jgi:hypothetical protein